MVRVSVYRQLFDKEVIGGHLQYWLIYTRDEKCRISSR